LQFDANAWKSEEQMHDALKSTLSFPDYYGKNLNALDECMCEDIAIPDDGGLVIVLRRYDEFAKEVQFYASECTFAEVVLHVLGKAVRYHMLFGRRLLILVQSGDPRVRFENLAAVAAQWNPREWLAKNRGL
jgi:RNAse (barnase) inhibitor barstar